MISSRSLFSRLFSWETRFVACGAFLLRVTKQIGVENVTSKTADRKKWLISAAFYAAVAKLECRGPRFLEQYWSMIRH
jgi:hypothetical protein